MEVYCKKYENYRFSDPIHQKSVAGPGIINSSSPERAITIKKETI
jgi:hypothetical protein